MTVFRVADRVGVIDDGEHVFLAALPGGPIIVLEGTAALIWRVACSGPADGLVERVAPDVEHGAEDISAAVLAFAGSLVRQGYLVRV